MYTQANQMLCDLSETAQSSKKLYKRASKHAPRMKKEITVRSSYFSCGHNKAPCAETLIKLDIDCNLLKLMILLLAGMLVLSLYCSIKHKKR